MSNLIIWSNASFPPAVLDDMRQALLPHRLVQQSADAAPLADVDVALGQPDPRQIIESPRVRWVHLTTAGYTRYDTPAFRDALVSRGGFLTNSSSVYDEPCAQHVLAMMLSLARRLPDAWSDQRGDRTWPQSTLRRGSHLLTGQTAVIFGYGAIARRLTELLMPLRMTLIGVRRTPSGAEPITIITSHEADDWLARADHVIDILPASAGTENYFDARRLNRIKPGAIFYNIGRGTTVDQPALIAALKSGQLAAACLDVTEPEPLPPGHPLWTTPNCYLTPHTAGGHADEPQRLARHFVENVKRFAAGETMGDRVF